MHNGSYISQRLLPGMVQAACQRQSIDFASFSDDWVLRLQKGSAAHWIIGYKFDLNSSAASELAQDKVATYAVLKSTSVPAVEHYLVRAAMQEPIHQAELTQLDMPVVAKPLSGTGGHGVAYYQTAAVALEMVQASAEPAWALSPFYEVQAEYRVVLLNGQPLVYFQKTQPAVLGELKLFNLSQGAQAADISDYSLLTKLVELAQNTLQALTLRLAAVDIIRTADGQLLTLEVNDGFSMEYFAHQNEQYKHRTAAAYDTIVTAVLA